MNDHALKVLEFNKILEYLENYTESQLTRDAIRQLQPLTDHKELTRQLKVLKEFRYLRSSGQDIPNFTGPEADLSQSIDASKTRGWRLSAERVYAIGHLLTNSANIRDGLLKLEGIPMLRSKVAQLKLIPELRKKIVNSVNKKGEIEDKASKELAGIRRNIRRLQEKLRGRMESLAIQLHKNGCLQDPVVMIREGRLVLPVKAGSAREVPGTIRDRSASGATFFIEPKVSSSDNMELEKLDRDEIKEKNRILTDITAQIGHNAESLLTNLDLVLEMDLIQSKARFCDEIHATPILPGKTPTLNLKKCRNPLLVLHRLYSNHPDETLESVVPIDIAIDDTERVLVITGPNTGGKTVALKTVGLTILMVQAGLHPICDEFSEIGIFQNIFADIGDEQSLQQNLSTFSSHVKQIIEIIEYADHQSIVLLDELGAGTDPAEGSALGISILSELIRRNVWGIANTHHNSIKAFAFTSGRIKNAAMEFDITTLRPTFRILLGRIGQSNALSIAERLGFPKRLIKDAREHLEGKTVDLQKMIDQVELRRITAEKQIAKASNERYRAKELRQAREDILKKAEKDALEIRQKAADEAQEILSSLLTEKQLLKREIRQIRKRLGKGSNNEETIGIDDIGKNLDRQAESVSKFRDKALQDPEEPLVTGKIQPGDSVWVRRFQAKARVLKRESDSRVLIDLNGKKVRIPLSDLQKVKKTNQLSDVTIDKDKRISVNVEVSDLEPPALRLNLVGMRVDEAMDELSRYMDMVVRFKLPQVTIIHGFGTGRLQNAVVKYLKRSRLVLRARRGEGHEGGGGVTVVEMDI